MVKRRDSPYYTQLSEPIPTIVIDGPSDEVLYVDETCAGDRQTDDLQNSVSDFLPNPSSERRVSIRRKNSISLPNLDDLTALREAHGIESSGDITNSENEGSEFEELGVSFRVRRKSVINPNMLKPPEDDSPGNSITSVNSLASLLREKMQMLPATFKKKKSADYKIRIFVVFLFIGIVLLVSFAYALYQQKVLQKAYFEKVKLNNAKRVMRIFNDEGSEIVKVNLGTTLNYDTVHPCLPADQKTDGSICLEWMHRARMYLNSYFLDDSVVKCYNVKWISLSRDVEPTDCIDLSTGHWYGGGQNAESAWPLEKGKHDFAPFITGRVDKHEWGNVLKRYFISSKGAAVIIDDKSPLYTSITNGPPKQLCLKAKYDYFAFVNRLTPTAELDYSICTNTEIGLNMVNLHLSLIENKGRYEEDMDVINSLLTEPLWEITSATKDELTQDAITNYTESVVLGDLKQGHVLINEFWQKHVGDFKVDLERFPNLEKTLDKLHRRGFRIVFSIQPYVSTESFNFAEAVKKKLLISERFSDKRIPALTRYKSVLSAGVLDTTNEKTMPWLLEELKAVAEKYKFDAYYLDLGIAYDMPHYYQCEKPLINPDYYKTLLIGSLESKISLFGVNNAVSLPKTPIFVSLSMFESSWDGLRRVIPTVLTYGILGYPFLIPGAVGGDFEGLQQIKESNVTSVLLPDKELYVRWLQLASFLPVIKFTHLPNTYGDQNLLDVTKALTKLRLLTVSPLLKKYALKALESGLPIIRPLWMLEPNDPSCHVVMDEFSIGEDLIVAPVLYSGARQREIYLPAGVWKDGIDGSLRKGSRWIHDYKVEEQQVAYFEKMPDNTRF